MFEKVCWNTRSFAIWFRQDCGNVESFSVWFFKVTCHEKSSENLHSEFCCSCFHLIGRLYIEAVKSWMQEVAVVTFWPPVGVGARWSALRVLILQIRPSLCWLLYCPSFHPWPFSISCQMFLELSSIRVEEMWDLITCPVLPGSLIFSKSLPSDY